MSVKEHEPLIRWILIAVLLAFAALNLYHYFQLRSGRTDRVLLLTGLFPALALLIAIT